VKIVNGRTDQAVFFIDFDPAPEFLEGESLLFLDVPIHPRFPEPGAYTAQFWFFQDSAGDILKMEQPFYLLESEI